MLRRLSILVTLLLVITVVVTGCGRYTVAVEESEIPYSEPPVDTRSPELTVEPPVADEKTESDGELIPFAQNLGFDLVYGYMDEAGNVVIQPQHGSAESFLACGLAVVGDTNGKLGLIDRAGEFVVSPEADFITYGDGVFIAQIYGEGTVARAYDEKGEFLFEKPDYIYPFSDGLSRVYREDGSAGYIDKSGNMVLELPYKEFSIFLDGVARVSNKYGGPTILIDKQGNDLTDKLSSGLRMVEENSLFGYEDMDGNRVIEPRFRIAEPFRNGFAIVAVDGVNTSYGIIDTQGNYVLEPEYCVIRRARNGSFIVGEKLKEDVYMPPMYEEYCKKALFSSDLKRNTEWIFVEMDSFDEKYTCVSDGNRIYYLDAQLDRATHLPEFSGRGLMLADGSRLRGTINGHTTVADRAGNILMKDEGLTFLEDGVRTRTVTWFPHDCSTITYTIIEGLKDTGLQDELNQIIEEEAKGYWSYLEPDAEDPYFFPILDVNCSVMINKDLMHIELGLYEYWFGAAHGGYYWGNTYVNTRDGKIYTIDDLFISPEAGRKRLSEKVTEGMQEEPERYFQDYVEPEQIQAFHLENDGLIIYFGEYEIAPYAAGLPEFYIPFSEIMDLIDTEGDFWKAFN